MVTRIGLDLRLVGAHEGGIAEYARRLASWLPRLDPAREYLPFLRRGASFSGPGRRLWTPPHHRFERLMLSAELLPRRLALFHSPDFVPPRAGGFRRVITVQDLAFLAAGDVVPREVRRYYGRWIRTAVAEADAVIAISEATKRALVDAIGAPEDRIRVTPLGRDERLRPRPPHELRGPLARYGLEPGYLLSVGSFEWRKNQALLLRAYRRLTSRCGEVGPLVLAGYRGPTLAGLRELVRELDLDARVVFLVNVPAEDLPFVYAGASLFALVSLDEGFGLPLVDAMACGLPCVVSSRGALPEVAAGNALEIASMSVEETAEALALLSEDSELRRRLSEGALERSRAFTWEETARGTLAVYDELLGSRGGGA